MARRVWLAPVKTGTGMLAVDWVNYFETFHNALIACGLTQTSDTGQMATLVAGTFTIPAIGIVGYRMYQLNDSLSATSPVLIRVNFRCNDYKIPTLEVLAGGPSTNGAGTLLNSTGAVGYPVGTNSTDSSTSMIRSGNFFNYVSAGEGYLAVALGVGSRVSSSNTSYAFNPGDFPMDWFVVARPSDMSGSLLPDRVSATSINRSITLSGGIGLYHSTYLASESASVKYGASAARSMYFLAQASPETARTRNGSVVVSRCFNDFRDPELLVNPALAGYSYSLLSPGDTISIALAGAAEYEYIAPHQGISSLSIAMNLGSSSTGTRGGDVYQSPLLRWDGPDV